MKELLYYMISREEAEELLLFHEAELAGFGPFQCVDPDYHRARMHDLQQILDNLP